MLTTIESLRILNLSSLDNNLVNNIDNKITSTDVENAYLKMIKRYPPEIFPQKVTKIRKAYNTLIINDEYMNELFFSEEINSDLTFLLPYLKPNTPNTPKQEEI